MKPEAGVSPCKAAQGTGKSTTNPFAKKLGGRQSTVLNNVP
jgi:hypothetical protein